jgi:Flp pilus assembly protein TadG
MPDSRHSRRRRESGNSIIEFGLFVPWLILLFVGALDWGFFAYSLIATEAAARIGALYTSTSSTTVTDSTTACTYALDQLRDMSNVGASLTTCASGSSVTSSAPVGISATSITGPDGNPAAQLSVTYLTPVFMPLPGLLPSHVTITRTFQMRVRS